MDFEQQLVAKQEMKQINDLLFHIRRIGDAVEAIAAEKSPRFAESKRFV